MDGIVTTSVADFFFAGKEKSGVCKFMLVEMRCGGAEESSVFIDPMWEIGIVWGEGVRIWGIEEVFEWNIKWKIVGDANDIFLGETEIDWKSSEF